MERKLALIYGLRLLPAEELDRVESGHAVLKNGQRAGVTLHLIEGENEDDIRRRLLESLDAYFEFYPEV